MKRTIEVESSAISEVSYDEDTHTMYWRMRKSGKEYAYPGVNPFALNQILLSGEQLGWGKAYNKFKQMYQLAVALVTEAQRKPSESDSN